jgi:vitamin B12 transporter
MLRRSAFLKARSFPRFFLTPNRLMCIGFLMAQSLAWAEPEELHGTDEAKELEKFVIVGNQDELTILEQSALAIDVIDLKPDQKLTADLSEVLSREPGISIRRMGGLGSRERFSLNGLEDEQIRFFIDGVPLEMSGYTFGIGSIPVNLVSRADIYHGVVPIELGADALGGAVNFITDKDQEGTGGSISHMLGSFNKSRTSVSLNSLTTTVFLVALIVFTTTAIITMKWMLRFQMSRARKNPIKLSDFMMPIKAKVQI